MLRALHAENSLATCLPLHRLQPILYCKHHQYNLQPAFHLYLEGIFVYDSFHQIATPMATLNDKLHLHSIS